MDRLLEVIRRARALTDAVLVSFSCGKDSAVLLDLCCRHFARVEAFFMYVVPGLSFQEAYLDWFAARYGVTIHRVPSWTLAGMLATASYRPPTRQALDCPTLTLADVWQYVRGRTGIDWIADGSKAADSFKRRQMLIGWKGLYAKGRRVYPLTQWSDKTVAAYLKARRLPLSPEYKVGMKRSFNSLCEEQLVPLAEHFPDDFARVCARFPYARAVVERARDRRRRESVSAVPGADGPPQPAQERPVQSPGAGSECPPQAQGQPQEAGPR